MGLVSLATSLLAFGSVTTAASLAERNGNSKKLTPGLCPDLVLLETY